MTVLADAAFGDDPGHWPLPAASGGAELWLRAVAAGGQGRYASARADLAALSRRHPTGRWASLAASTAGSFLRQQGWHGIAHDWDGRAWARADGDPESGIDALVGLAADALGTGRLSAAAALLDRARAVLGRADEPPARLGIRLAWVHAELAMAGGSGAEALDHARRGVELAEQALPALRRHRVKSDVVLAAALSCDGNLALSRTVAEAALEASQRAGLVPLTWALACLLTDIGAASYSDAEIADIRDRSAAFVSRHGGRWSRR